MIQHPRLDEHGHPVCIRHPSVASPLCAWADPAAVATVLPDGQLPPELNGTPLVPWQEAPQSRPDWEPCGSTAFEDPPFHPNGLKPAAGAVVVEHDGRVWLVAPTNAFGGYQATFPKGTAKHLDLRATAVKEVFEEAGLRVELGRHLVDVSRSLSRTRYYLARRTGGSPAAMGWESQAVHLVPLDRLKELLNQPVDHVIVAELAKALG